jgi:hypothetical protein
MIAIVAETTKCFLYQLSNLVMFIAEKSHRLNQAVDNGDSYDSYLVFLPAV